MTGYAERTKVSPEQSRVEIEQTLSRFGATAFMYAWSGDAAVLQFQMQEPDRRQVKFVLPMPELEEYRITKSYIRRTDAQTKAAWEQEVRRRWRSLLLSIKAKLDSVASGIFTFDQEFLPHIVLPDGQTAGEWLLPQLEEAYQSSAMPTRMVLALPPASETGGS